MHKCFPLFGIGQRFIPSGNVESRRYAFLLLCVYVASGMALLLTTSFLGLRRYLRQRRLEMPMDMAGVWLAVGSLLIVVLLVVSSVLPRPSSEFALSKFPLRFGSPDHQQTNRHAFGNDGPQQPQGTGQRPDNQRESSSRKSSSQSQQKDGSQPGQKGDSGQSSKAGQQKKGRDGQSQGRGEEKGKSSAAGKQKDKSGGGQYDSVNNGSGLGAGCE